MMDRAEKIITALVIVALIAVLLHSHRRRGHKANLTGVNVMQSAERDDFKRGPAYLLSALPDHRRSNDAVQDVGFWPYSDDYAYSED